jgi:hypothetical protein
MYTISDRDDEHFHTVEGRARHRTDETLARRRRGD